MFTCTTVESDLIKQRGRAKSRGTDLAQKVGTGKWGNSSQITRKCKRNNYATVLHTNFPQEPTRCLADLSQGTVWFKRTVLHLTIPQVDFLELRNCGAAKECHQSGGPSHIRIVWFFLHDFSLRHCEASDEKSLRMVAAVYAVFVTWQSSVFRLPTRRWTSRNKGLERCCKTSTQNMLRFGVILDQRRGQVWVTVRHERETLGDWEPFGRYFAMPWRNRAIRVDGRLVATQKYLLSNFEWEVRKTEWKDDHVCIGWLGRLLRGSLSHPVGHHVGESRRKRV